MGGSFIDQLKAALWKHYKVKKACSRSDMAKDFFVPFAFSFLICSMNASGRESALAVLPIYLPMAFLQFFRSFIYQVLDEKKKRMKEYLKMMGLGNAAYLWGWIIGQALEAILVSMIIVGIFTYDEILTTQQAIKAMLLFWIYSMVAVQYGFVTTCFFSDQKLGTQMAIFMFQVPLFLSYAMPVVKSQFLRALICIFPQPAIVAGFRSLLGVPVLDFPVVIAVMVTAGIFYGFLSLYLDQVIPNEFGVPKPWYFPLQMCSKKKQRSQEAREFDLEGSLHPYLSQDDDNSSSYRGDARVSSALYQDDSEQSSSQPSMRVELLRKEFGNTVAVDDVTLNIYKDQIFCLLGHNGAGKTTTINLVTGFYTATKGKIFINGRDLSQSIDSLRQKLGVCPQTEIVFDQMTVEDHLDLVAKIKALNPVSAAREKSEVLNDVGLLEHKWKKVKQLSGGMKRRLALAMSLVGGSEIIMLDEPTSGLDPMTRYNIWEVLQRVKRGRTLILTTHFMEEADELADRIGVMSHGKLLCLGSADFMKKKFGVGYQLTLEIKKEFESVTKISDLEPRVSKVIRSMIAGSSSDTTPSRQLMYILPFEQIDNFAPMLEELEKIEQIKMSLDMTSLEEAFVNIGMHEEKFILEAGGDTSSIPSSAKYTAAVDQTLEFLSPRFNSQTSNSGQFKALLDVRYKQFVRQWQFWLRWLFPPIMFNFMMPSTDQVAEEEITYVLFYCYFPLVLALSLGLYVFTPAVERELKLRYMFRVVGLKTSTYWLVTVIFDTILYVIQSGILIASLLLRYASGYWYDRMPVVAATVVFGGIAVILSTHFIGFIFTKSASAFKYSFLLQYFVAYLVPFIIFIILMVNDHKDLVAVFGIFMMFNPIWVSFFTLSAAYGPSFLPLLVQNPWLCILNLVFLIFFYFYLVTYFDSKELKPVSLPVMNSPTVNEPSVLEEENRVCRPHCNDQVQLKNMYKMYPNGVQAVSNVTFGAQSGEIIGLLGPNGAGKSTTFNVLTCELPKSAGDFKILDSHVRRSDSDLFLKVGVCPQFNPIWSKLNVYDHLMMMARIKGLNYQMADQQVNSIIECLHLAEYRKTYGTKLSGGNKRKLLIAMTLVAGTQVQFLDEPSTGIDPLARRMLWNICTAVSRQGDSSIILATHLMEEAEALCDKIAIMVNGRLQAFGSPSQLKDRYGTGYRIIIEPNYDAINNGFNLIENMQRLLPNIEELVGNPEKKVITYQVKTDTLVFHEVFRHLQDLKNQNLIADYSIKQSTMKQVFIHFASQQQGAIDPNGQIIPGQVVSSQFQNQASNSQPSQLQVPPSVNRQNNGTSIQMASLT